MMLMNTASLNNVTLTQEMVKMGNVLQWLAHQTPISKSALAQGNVLHWFAYQTPISKSALAQGHMLQSPMLTMYNHYTNHR